MAVNTSVKPGYYSHEVLNGIIDRAVSDLMNEKKNSLQNMECVVAITVIATFVIAILVGILIGYYLIPYYNTNYI